MNTSIESITVRPAYADDERALLRLAALDSAAVPPAPLLVAEVDGELRAALSLRDRSAIADPFHFTGLHLELLRTRAASQGRAREWRPAHRRPLLRVA